MRDIISIWGITACLTIRLCCSTPSNQVKFGAYTHDDSLQYSDLEIFKNHKFVFDDMRSESCWLWMKYEGNWTLKKDTLIFTWQSLEEEYPIQESSSIDRFSKKITLTFKYEDNEPISNVKICYLCELSQSPKYSYTDKNGKVNFSQNKVLDHKNEFCTETQRQLYFDIKDGPKGIIPHEEQSEENNVYNMVVKRNPKSYYVTEVRKFLLSNDKLICLDSNKKDRFRYWGNFKFLTKEERELREKEDTSIQVKKLITP
jgi:hypothetical protein